VVRKRRTIYRESREWSVPEWKAHLTRQRALRKKYGETMRQLTDKKRRAVRPVDAAQPRQGDTRPTRTSFTTTPVARGVVSQHERYEARLAMSSVARGVIQGATSRLVLAFGPVEGPLEVLSTFADGVADLGGGGPELCRIGRT
jgi:hypothetical protein